MQFRPVSRRRPCARVDRSEWPGWGESGGDDGQRAHACPAACPTGEQWVYPVGRLRVPAETHTAGPLAGARRCKVVLRLTFQALGTTGGVTEPAGEVSKSSASALRVTRTLEPGGICPL